MDLAEVISLRGSDLVREDFISLDSTDLMIPQICGH